MGRKKFRNIRIDQILSYRLPAAGIMSILHRVSGASLFLMFPFIVYFFDLSLSSERGYEKVLELLAHPFFFIIYVGLLWAFSHHFFAGIRHLVCDLHFGLSKESASKWGMVVNVSAILLTIILAILSFKTLYF